MMHFIVFKEKNNYAVNTLLLFLSHFQHPFFTLNSIVLFFFLTEAQEYFLLQGAVYPSYATDIKISKNFLSLE